MFRLLDWRYRAWLARESGARTRGVLIGKGSEAEHTRERKDLCCWCPVRMRFPAEAKGCESLGEGCGLSVPREGWSYKALSLPPPAYCCHLPRFWLVIMDSAGRVSLFAC